MTKITSVIPGENYQLFVRLSNGKEGYFDVSPYINKGIFQELKNIDYFSKVRIVFGGVAWPHSQDFSCDTIEYEIKKLQNA